MLAPPKATRKSTEMFPLEHHRTRYRAWLAQLKQSGILPREHLIPQLIVPVPNELPALMASRNDITTNEAEVLRRRVQALTPWGYSIYLGGGLYTAGAQHNERMIYRSHLITGAVRKLTSLKGATVLDLACNHGYFSIEAASYGAKAYGVDLREVNINKALLLKEHFGVDDVEFRVQNVYDIEGEFDVVYNLGLLYHVTDPYNLIAKTYSMAKRIAVIDTVTHHMPVSAFVQRSTKNVSIHSEGEYEVELHPTYRAVIDLMHAVGFKDVREVVPTPNTPNPASHRLYEKLERRCFVGFK